MGISNIVADGGDWPQVLTDSHLLPSPMSKFFMPTRVSIGTAISRTARDEQPGLNCLSYRHCSPVSPIPPQPHRDSKNGTNPLIPGPPIPEKGAPPTIIVTPAEPASTQDFQIHFVSPTSSCSTFFQSSSRLSRFLLRFPGSGPEPETKWSRGPTGLGITTRWRDDKRSIIAYNGYEPCSPIPPVEHGAIRLPEDEDEFDDEEHFAIKIKERRGSSTKKMRVILFLMLPVLLVLLHLVGAWMGFGLRLGFSALETEAHRNHDDLFHLDLWEWRSTRAVVMDDPYVPGTLTAEGSISELEAATTTLDVESAPTPVTIIVNDTL